MQIMLVDNTPPNGNSVFEGNAFRKGSIPKRESQFQQQ
jgi:hypothetical protein